jgi:cytochrome c553
MITGGAGWILSAQEFETSLSGAPNMNVIVRRVGLVIGSLCLLLILVATAGYAVSQRRITRKYEVAAESIPIPTDSLSIARGRHLARALAKCADCHGEDLGGRIMSDNPAMGRWATTNLTRGRGGIGGIMRDEDWVRAIRHAVGHDGRPLLIMPAIVYRNLSAGDVGQIVAYVKSVPPVDRELPPLTLGPVARGLIATNKVPFFDAARIDHTMRAPALAPAEGPTVEYGKYIVRTAGCDDCHGQALSGGKIETGDPAWPVAPNITPTGLQAYDEAGFFTAMRAGTRPGGSKINEAMPTAWTREMTDDEIRAVWLYLKTVPPRKFGAR